MSEIVTLNGYSLADTTARAGLAALQKKHDDDLKKNLLKNSDWRAGHFIAHSGILGLYNNEICLGDRWSAWGFTSATLTDDGIVCDVQDGALISQIVSGVAGKTFTFACKTNSTNEHKLTVYTPDLSQSIYVGWAYPNVDGVILVNVSMPSDIDKAAFIIYPENSMKYSEPVLYEGSYTVDTLPPYIPTHPRVENLKIGNPVQPYNLLDNSDFRKPMNQRGQTAYTVQSAEYTLDRWEMTSAAAPNSNMELKSDGSVWYISLSAVYGHFFQKIRDFSRHKGKTLTLAMECHSYASGNGLILLINTGITQEAVSIAKGLNVVSCFIPEEATQIAVGVQNNNANVAVAFYPTWAALFEGSYTQQKLCRPMCRKGMRWNWRSARGITENTHM